MDTVQICIYKKIKSKFGCSPNINDYDDTWSFILKRKQKNSNVYPGAFTSWDNTPRKGEKATLFVGSTPAKFAQYIKEQTEKAEKEHRSAYLFINAWNEWGEGAHLEPDEVNKYGYLEGIRDL